MHKAPVMKGSGLPTPVEDSKSTGEVHVFGKNLEDRVVSNEEEATPSISFDTNQGKNNPADEDIDIIRKRKFDAITGEEDEDTMFQGDFKLFIWDLATSNWIEKGRGQLKLNDSMKGDAIRSRLIMRVGGTLKIVLNVAIKRSYFKIIAHSKTNIRFTDSQHVWAASGSNANQLKELIEKRLQARPDEDDQGEKVEEEDSKKRPKSDSEADDEEQSSCPKKNKPESDGALTSDSSAKENTIDTPTQADPHKNNDYGKKPAEREKGQSSNSGESDQTDEPKSDATRTNQGKEPADQGESSEPVDADDKTYDEGSGEAKGHQVLKHNKKEPSSPAEDDKIDSNGKEKNEEQCSRNR